MELFGALNTQKAILNEICAKSGRGRRGGGAALVAPNRAVLNQQRAISTRELFQPAPPPGPRRDPRHSLVGDNAFCQCYKITTNFCGAAKAALSRRGPLRGYLFGKFNLKAFETDHSFARECSRYLYRVRLSARRPGGAGARRPAVRRSHVRR